MKNSLIIICLFWIYCSSAQGNPNDYYYQIPDYPSEYTPGNVAARVVDGLGFRYYWATEGLKVKDLSYRPSVEARSVEETIDHIAVLTKVILNAVSKQSHTGTDMEGMAFEDKRAFTLENIRLASERLKNSAIEDLDQFDIIFSSEINYPFWNLLNGPIADAINHVGQIITFRRTNGNPIYQKISVLRGTVKSE